MFYCSDSFPALFLPSLLHSGKYGMRTDMGVHHTVQLEQSKEYIAVYVWNEAIFIYVCFYTNSKIYKTLNKNYWNDDKLWLINKFYIIVYKLLIITIIFH